jgi:hypothetical protein
LPIAADTGMAEKKKPNRFFYLYFLFEEMKLKDKNK